MTKDPREEKRYETVREARGDAQDIANEQRHTYYILEQADGSSRIADEFDDEDDIAEIVPPE